MNITDICYLERRAGMLRKERFLIDRRVNWLACFIAQEATVVASTKNYNWSFNFVTGLDWFAQFECYWRINSLHISCNQGLETAMTLFWFLIGRNWCLMVSVIFRTFLIPGYNSLVILMTNIHYCNFSMTNRMFITSLHRENNKKICFKSKKSRASSKTIQKVELTGSADLHDTSFYRYIHTTRKTHAQ